MYLAFDQPRSLLQGSRGGECNIAIVQMIESSALYSLLNRLKDVLPSKNLQLLAISLTALKGQRKRVIPHHRKVVAEVALKR